MKVLLDTCVVRNVKVELVATGFDVLWTGEWDEDPGDEEILTLAAAQQRVLVTMDKDFGELAVLYNQMHCGIVRLSHLATHQQASVCRRVLEEHYEELQTGAIITVEPGRLRIRPPNGHYDE